MARKQAPSFVCFPSFSYHSPLRCLPLFPLFIRILLDLKDKKIIAKLQEKKGVKEKKITKILIRED